MRKAIHTIFVLAAAALLWTGCDDKSVPGENRGRAIDFSCSAEKSRAQATTAENIASFRVSAVWTKAANDYAPKYMDKQAVDKIDGIWTYSPVCYMPSYGSVDFFAYSPAEASVSDFGFGGEPYDNLSLAYDVTSDPAAQHDFMVAANLKTLRTPVQLEFQHALSSVRVTARSAVSGTTFRVYDVKLLNLNRKGVLSAQTGGDPQTTNWTWSAQSDLTTYTIAQNGPVDASATSVAISDPDVGPLMVLPQTVEIGNKDDVVESNEIAADQYPAWMLGLPRDVRSSFYVAATYEPVDGGGSITGIKTTVYLPLADLDDPSQPFTFEMGKRYVLHIDIEQIETRSANLSLPSGATSARLSITTEDE
ncbi:fimbrillin family protein [Alistipes sp. OttesenSCG-928-B03]|nr:fimbrillin family protein [Alistipes sp. OttesenSCG-928-B03]